MLRDSNLQLDRLSPTARVMTIGAVLLCGLLAAGIRGPSGPTPALADDLAKPTAADDSIDATYMIEKALGIVVMRPAAVLARPELAALARFLERTGNVLPNAFSKGTRLADFRQITVIFPAASIPSGPVELRVLQWEKPVAKEELAQRLTNGKFAVKERNGKKIYVPLGGGRVVMLCDDHTVVEARSEQAIDVYLAGNLGVLPKWLPAKTWELFRKDHFMIAADAALMRRELKLVTDRFSPPIVRAALLPISAVCEDATGMAAGMRLDDKLAVHAWAAGKNADSSENLRRTAEALKTLVESVVQNFQAPSPSGRQSQPKAVSILLGEANRLLHNMSFQKEGNDVQLQTSIELDKPRLGVLGSAIVAATQPPDPSTNNGMMALVEDFFHHNWRDVTSRETIEWGQPAKTKEGNFSIRYKYRARYWWGDPKIVNQIFTFNRQGMFVSVNDAEKRPPPPPAKVYEVRKKVSDFPDREDLATPEAAYASIHRAYVAEGDAAWPRLSVPALAVRMPGGAKRPLPKESADWLLGAEILEVHVWEGTHGEGPHAVVLAREESGSTGVYRVDMRWLTRLDGRWLNEGNDSRRTIQEARQKVEQGRSR